MPDLKSFLDSYKCRLKNALDLIDLETLQFLYDDIKKCQANGNKIIIFGNGGSAANSIHIANDFIYGATINDPCGLDIVSLSANPAVLTCLANDISFSEIYSHQIKSIAKKGDVVIALSGSGNSKNILQALKVSRVLGLKTYGVYGFDGGQAISITDEVFHININDMQISEDIQLIIFHILMQWMSKKD